MVLEKVRAHLRGHFGSEPDSASVTFLGVEPIEVLRFGPDAGAVVHYVSLGCSRRPMGDPAQLVADPLRGPRAEIVMRLRAGANTAGLARAVAVVAAAPAVEGVVLAPDALIDLGSPLWQRSEGGPSFSAVLLGPSDIGSATLEAPADPVRFLAAVPITANEAAWVRLKGAAALRETWQQAGIDTTDPERTTAQPT